MTRKRSKRSLLTRCVLATGLILALAIPSASQIRENLQQTAARIAGSALTDEHASEYLRNLTDQFGGRVTGTAAYQRAAEWTASQFRAAGIQNVKLEPFTIPNGWERGTARGQMAAPIERSFEVESFGWSPSTPAGGAKGEVIFLSDLSAETIRAQAGQIKGRICLLDVAAIFSGGDAIGIFARLEKMWTLLKDAGAVAVVWPGNVPNNVADALPGTLVGRAIPLPMVGIGLEDEKLVRRWMEKGAVTLEFEIQNRVSGPTTVNNVVAEIRGREKPDEWIIIGAHLDSWDFGTGAQDNGSGVAQVLEAARVLAAMREAPRRSVRFALWGGEEQGILGSLAYARAHAGELSKCIAVLNTDNGAGHPRGWKVEGNNALRRAMSEVSPLLVGLGGDGLSNETTFDTDHGPFMLEGIPSLDLWVDMSHYGEVHHKPSDTFDKVNRHNLAAGAAILAVTAYVIAERAEPIAPHLDHAAVGEILKKAKLEEGLKELGVWK